MIDALSTAICRATGKKVFRSPEQAERRRKHIRRKYDERLHSYRCDNCGFWHLGHGMHSTRDVDTRTAG